MWTGSQKRNKKPALCLGRDKSQRLGSVSLVVLLFGFSFVFVTVCTFPEVGSTESETGEFLLFFLLFMEIAPFIAIFSIVTVFMLQSTVLG